VGVYEPHIRAKVEAPSQAQQQETSSVLLQLPQKMQISKDDMRKHYRNGTFVILQYRRRERSRRNVASKQLEQEEPRRRKS
jgi:hypothetical protein